MRGIEKKGGIFLLKKGLFYILVIFSVLHIISFIYSIIQYDNIRILDLASTIAFLWTAIIVREKLSMDNSY